LNPRHADYDLVRRSPPGTASRHIEPHQLFGLIGYLHHIPRHANTSHHIQPHASLLPIRYPSLESSIARNAKAVIGEACGEWQLRAQIADRCAQHERQLLRTLTKVRQGSSPHYQTVRLSQCESDALASSELVYLGSQSSIR